MLYPLCSGRTPATVVDPCCAVPERAYATPSLKERIAKQVRTQPRQPCCRGQQSLPTSFADAQAERRSSQGPGRLGNEGPIHRFHSRQSAGRTRTCRVFRASPQFAALRRVLAMVVTAYVAKISDRRSEVNCPLAFAARPYLQ